MGYNRLLYCLFVDFILALISMNIRILSGFLFLISAIVTIPLVLLIVTLIIPILFFYYCVMLFIKKDKVEMVYNIMKSITDRFMIIVNLCMRPPTEDDYYDVPKYEKVDWKSNTVYDQRTGKR